MTSPSVFRAGVSHKIEMRIFNEESIRVNANLFDGRGELIATDSEVVSSVGYLNLKVFKINC